MRTQIFRPGVAIAIAIVLVGWAGQSKAQTSKIISSGLDQEKLVMAVVGDGYAAGEQLQYQADVQRLISGGVFGDDFFRDNQKAFNVYRVDLVSNSSGVTTQTEFKDSSLATVYTGDWNRCWIEDSGATDGRLRQALKGVPRYDYVIILLNEKGFGGCARGRRLYITRGVDWDVVAHEFGHTVGNLDDEYWNEESMFPSGVLHNERNCSNVVDRTRLTWASHLQTGTMIPTVWDPNGTDPSTVGMFEGCHYNSRGIYRPSYDCRMRTNTPGFCPVCSGLLREFVGPYLMTPAPGPGGAPLQPYLALVVKLNKNGMSEIISSSEVRSKIELQNSNVTSEYVYQVTQNGKTIGADYLSANPFIERSFADPNTKRGELVKEVDSTTFVIKIPKLTFQQVESGNINLMLYEISNFQELPAEINLEQFQQFKDQFKLKEKINFSPGGFKNKINMSSKQKL